MHVSIDKKTNKPKIHRFAVQTITPLNVGYLKLNCKINLCIPLIDIFISLNPGWAWYGVNWCEIWCEYFAVVRFYEKLNWFWKNWFCPKYFFPQSQSFSAFIKDLENIFCSSSCNRHLSYRYCQVYKSIWIYVSRDLKKVVCPKSWQLLVSWP